MYRLLRHRVILDHSQLGRLWLWEIRREARLPRSPRPLRLMQLELLHQPELMLQLRQHRLLLRRQITVVLLQVVHGLQLLWRHGKRQLPLRHARVRRFFPRLKNKLVNKSSQVKQK